jgi:chromosome segregation ATPase
MTEELQAKLAETRKILDGTNRRNTQLEKEMKELQAVVESYKGYTPEELEKRIQNIESVYQQKTAKLELDFYIKGRALEAGVDPTLLDGIPFESKETAEAYIAKLGDTIASSKVDATNRMMMSAQVPQAGGQAPKPKQDVYGPALGEFQRFERIQGVRNSI